MTLKLNETPKWSKLLPLLGIAAGVGLAIYQKKDCIGCFLGYSLSGLIIGSVPVIYYAKKAGEAEQKVAETIIE